MKLIPHNRNISVELLEEEDDTGVTVLLPESYRPAEGPYTVVRVGNSGAAIDCQYDWLPGTLLVVESQMIRHIEYEGASFNTVAENYIVGSLVS